MAEQRGGLLKKVVARFRGKRVVGDAARGYPEDSSKRVPIEESTPKDVVPLMEHVQRVRKKYPDGAHSADAIFGKRPKIGSEEEKRERDK